MSISRLKLWEITTGAGINRRLTPERLGAGQCVESKNLLLEHGDWRARPGTQKLTGTALSAGKPVVGLYDFQKRDGRRFLLGACNSQLYVATGAGTAFNSLGIAAFSNLAAWECNPTYPAEFEAFPIRDAVYFANSGRDVAYRFDGTALESMDPIWPPTTPSAAPWAWGINFMQTLSDWTGAGGATAARWDHAIDSSDFYKGTGALKISASLSAAVGDYIQWDMNSSVDGAGNQGTKDWSLTDLIVWWTKSTRTGVVYSLQFSEDASTWYKYAVEIKEANVWQQVVWYFRDIPAASRDAVRYVRIVCEVAGLNTIRLDHLYMPGGLSLPGAYEYRVSYYDSTNGKESNPSDPCPQFAVQAPNATTQSEALCAGKITVPGTGDRCKDGSTKLQFRVYRKGGSYVSLWKRVGTLYESSRGTAAWATTATAPTAGSTRSVFDFFQDNRLGDVMASPHGHPRWAKFLKEHHSRMAWVYPYHESQANLGRWGAAVTAGTERITATVIENSGPIVGVVLRATTAGTGASLKAALEKKISGTYVEMRSASKTTAQLTANKDVLMMFATGVGDNYVKESPTQTWRLRVISSGGNAPQLATSDGTKITYRFLVSSANRLWLSMRYDPEWISGWDIMSGEVSEDVGGWIDFPMPEITALGKFGDDLMVFGRDRTYLLLGDTPETFRWPRVSARVGCTAPRSFVYAEQQAFWYGGGHFWTFDGQRIYAIDEPHGKGNSDVRPLLDDLSSTYSPNIVGEYDPKWRYIYWSYTKSGTTNNAVFVYDLKTNSFVRFEGINAFQWRARVVEQDVLYGDYNGHIWRYQRTDGKHMDGTAKIALAYESNHSDLAALDIQKRAIYLLAQGDGTSRTATLTHRLIVDGTLSSSSATHNLTGTGMQFDRLSLEPETSYGRYLGVRFSGTAATGAEDTRIRHLGVWFTEAVAQWEDAP
jgi:hypothetical protein